MLQIWWEANLEHITMQALSSWSPDRPVCGGWVGVTCNSQGDITGLCVLSILLAVCCRSCISVDVCLQLL